MCCVVCWWGKWGSNDEGLLTLAARLALTEARSLEAASASCLDCLLLGSMELHLCKSCRGESRHFESSHRPSVLSTILFVSTPSTVYRTCIQT